MEREFTVVKLHDSPELVKEAAQLLNDEWPRSFEARCDVIRHSSDDLPCSLVLLKVSTGSNVQKVVGFSHLCKVLQSPKSVLVESVIVDKTLRGCGLGKMIMRHTEEFAQKQGYVTIHLSTHDKQSFYEHLGYSLSTPVSPETKVSKYFVKLQTEKADDEVKHKMGVTPVGNPNDSGSEEKAKPSQCVMSLSSALSIPQPLSITPPITPRQSLPVPPPPPPSPPSTRTPTKPISSSLSKNHVWMKKKLYSHGSPV